MVASAADFQLTGKFWSCGVVLVNVLGGNKVSGT